jgi:hypothetical protein
MKSFLMFAVVSLAAANAFAIQPQPMQCQGTYRFSDGTRTIQVAATVISSNQLANVNVQETFTDNRAGKPTTSGYQRPVASADSNYNPRSPMYKGMNRFQLATSGWNSNNLFLPQVLPVAGTFRGVYQTVGHDGTAPVILACKIGR